MYFPFLRGKQYELLSLREFSPEIRASQKISPIIEPVKKELRGFETALNQLMDDKVNFTIVANPSVGEIKSNSMILGFISESENLLAYKNFQIGIHCYSEQQMNECLNLLQKFNLENIPLSIIHDDLLSDDNFIEQRLRSPMVKYNFFNENKIRGTKRYKRLFDKSTWVVVEDAFNIQNRNADYQSKPDELYSDEYQFYKDEGNVGFSDYLTIGEDFTEGGFLPYAVAIHITYLAKNKSIRIHHFVSETNDDYSDTPGKFAEALAKLIQEIPMITNGFKTKAIQNFESHYNAGHYPGLGSIKKLSILNHLELMNTLL